MKIGSRSAALLLICATAIAQTTSDQQCGDQWWAHVRVLADPAMKGRLTGSEEYLKAAAYVVDQFKQWGLKPAGVNGTYYQPVRFDVQRVVAEKSRLTLIGGDRETPLVIGEDAVLSTRMQQPARVEAPLIFLGYGLNLPESNYNDFDSKELPRSALKGKIIVIVNGGPADLPAPLKSYARTAPLIRAIRAAGALGVISIPTPKSMDFGWQRIASNSAQPGMRLAAISEDTIDSRQKDLFTATYNPDQAEKLFQGSPHTFAEILALTDAQKPLPRFPLARSLRATITTENTQVESPNIAAMLSGSDPTLRSQYVIVSAHLDHLGVGASIHGKTIYAGAMDDASGVATVLETARTLSRGERPRRSILFLVFTAEEKGLLR